MTFNIPKDLTPVSTTVTDSTPAHSTTALYLEGDEVQYAGDVYVMPLEQNNDVPDFDSADLYSRGDYAVYSGVASALERDVSQAINVPLTASAEYVAPTWEQLSNPNNTQWNIHETELSKELDSVAIKDTTMFVSMDGQTSGIGIIIAYDVTDSANPIEIGLFEDTAIATGRGKMVIEDNTIFMIGKATAVSNETFTAIDITDPTAMAKLSTLSNAALIGGYHFDISGNAAYLGCSSTDKVVSIDISDPTTMTIAGTFTNANLDAPEWVQVSATGSELFVVCKNTAKLVSLDISDPTTMSELGAYANSIFSGAIGYPALHGALLFLPVLTINELHIIDVSDATATVLLSTYTNASFSGAYYAHVDEDIVYLTLIGGAIVVLDISDPTVPSLVATIDAHTPSIDGISNVSFNGNRCYMVENPSTISLSYSDPKNSIGRFIILDIPNNLVGDDVGLYNFFTSKYETHMDVTITRISDSVEMAGGELYYVDSEDHIVRYFGTGCESGCGTDRVVFTDDGNAYIFTASYTHTNGAVAADFRDTYLSAYGFVYARTIRPSIPYDTTQYTSVIETGNQTWVVKSLTAFNGVALGNVRGDTISITFKDSIGATVGTPIVDQTIDNVIDVSLPEASVTEIFYAGSTIAANGTVEITIKGTETEIGKIFPTASYVVGSTNLQFSHEIVDFSKEQVSTISGTVDRIEGNKVIDYKGSYDIEMVDYDKAVMLQKYMTGRLVAVDGSDMINNEAADGQGRFASTKIICRIKRLSMKSTVKDDDIAITTPISFEFREIV